MWIKNLKIVLLVILVLGVYTIIANSIPQMQSEVPQAIDLSGAVTAEQLVSAGEKVFNGAGGCTACHGLGTRAPNLLTDEKGAGPIGNRCGHRKPNMDCKAYLYESLTQPTAYVVAGYQPIMPDMRRTLPPEQIWAVIAFLESNGGTVDVTPDDIKSTASPVAPGGTSGANGGAAAAPTASLKPEDIINANGCLGCHSLHGQGGTVGPHFDGVGSRRTADGIRSKILNPQAPENLTHGFENMKGVMPQTFGNQLTGAQLEALVHFLSGLK